MLTTPRLTPTAAASSLSGAMPQKTRGSRSHLLHFRCRDRRLRHWTRCGACCRRHKWVRDASSSSHEDCTSQAESMFSKCSKSGSTTAGFNRLSRERRSCTSTNIPAVSRSGQTSGANQSATCLPCERGVPRIRRSCLAWPTRSRCGSPSRSCCTRSCPCTRADSTRPSS